jgi:hypothetical protein
MIAGIQVPHPTISTEKMSLVFSPDSLIVSLIKVTKSAMFGAINSSNSAHFTFLKRSKSSIKLSILIDDS